MISHFGGVLFGGMTDMLFQLFLFPTVSGAGLSSSVPLQVGSATLFGALLTFMIDRRAKIVYFIPGVLLNIIGVVFDTLTYGSLQKDNKAYYEKENKDAQVDLIESETPTPRYSVKKIVIVCLCGALVGIPFGPGMALAGQEPHALSPYVLLPLSIHM